MKIKTFIFSPFDVNTYIIYDNTKECVIIDPACYDKNEQSELKKFIDKNKLNPKRLLNTHCHLDHVFGNNFVCDTFNLKAEACKEDEPVLKFAADAARTYGLKMETPYPIEKYLSENDIIKFGNSQLNILHIPGHSPGSLVYYSEIDKFAIVGDVLFNGSIGRTDLPGGDYDSLISNIKSKLFNLDDETIVYTGHGPATTIESEKITNPFVKVL